MAPEAIGTGTLRRLSALSTGGSATLSVYLDLETDSLCTPAGRDSQLRSLTTEPDLACARADIEQVRDLVAADVALTRAAQGLAIFSCAQAGILEALSLPCRVKPLVVLDTAAWLEPLVDMIAFGNRAVAVLGPVTARLLRGSSTTLAEFATLELLPRQHGCRSEPRSSSTGDLDRGVQSDAARIAEQLLRAHRRRARTDLVIVAREEARAPLDAALPAELQDGCEGRHQRGSHLRVDERARACSDPDARRRATRARASRVDLLGELAPDRGARHARSRGGVRDA